MNNLHKKYIGIVLAIGVSVGGAAILAHQFGTPSKDTSVVTEKTTNTKPQAKKKNPIVQKKVEVKEEDTAKAKANTGHTGEAVNIAYIDASKLEDGTYYGRARGYAGPISVAVTIHNGVIKDITITNQTETPEYFVMAKNVIGSILNAQSAKVDSISGATVSSNAIKLAVSRALAQAKPHVANPTVVANATTTTNNTNVGVQPPASIVTDTEDIDEPVDNKPNREPETAIVLDRTKPLKDGTFRGTALGYSDEPLVVDVVISGGKLSKINVIDNNEDVAYWKLAKKVIDDILSTGTTNDVDTVTNATYSSAAIRSAVSKALDQSIKAYVDAAKPEAVKPEATALELHTTSKLIYDEDEPINLQNLVVTIVMNNGTRENVDFNNFASKNISVSGAENGKTLPVGTHDMVVRYKNFSLTLTITVREKPKAETYVANLLGDYDNQLFVRPPELGAKLYDGKYIGHGRGFYAEPYISYARTTKIVMTVKNGKIIDMRPLEFGDDKGSGVSNFYIKTKAFRNRIFDLVKSDKDSFIKDHITFERYMAGKWHRNREFTNMKVFPGDDNRNAKDALLDAVDKMDALTGATYSNSGYSRAVAEALYKASKPEKQINDMYLEDYDLAKSLYLDERNGELSSYEYFGMNRERQKEYRKSKGYSRVNYHNGEKFDPARLVLTVEYTDGTTEKIPFEQLEAKGFTAQIWYQKDKSISPLTTETVLHATPYKTQIIISKKDGDKVIKSNYVNSDLYISN